MLFSICIPTHNRPRLLRQAIESALTQGIHDYEVIVIDNASDDSTFETVKAYLSRVRYFRHQELLSMPENWNSCFHHAAGKYITILHDDDLLAPDFLREVSKILLANPEINFLFGAVQLVSSKGEVLNIAIPRKIKGGKLEREEYLNAICRNYFFRCPGVVIRNDLLNKLEGFVSWLPTHSDYEFFVRVGFYSNIYTYEKSLAFYRRHISNLTKHSLTSGDSVKQMLCWLQRIEEGYEELSFTNKDALKTTLWKFIYFSFRLCGLSTDYDELIHLADTIRMRCGKSSPRVFVIELLLLKNCGRLILIPLRLKWLLSHLLYLLGKSFDVILSGSWTLAYDEIASQLKVYRNEKKDILRQE